MKKTILLLLSIILFYNLVISLVSAQVDTCVSADLYINPNDLKVQEAANQIAIYPKTPEYCWDNAKSAYDWVAKNIVYKPHDGTQLPSRTIELKSGDCDDQAYLLASLLRALGCPKDRVRVVVGSVWGMSAEIWHAWTEVYASYDKKYFLLSILPIQNQDSNIYVYLKNGSSIKLNTKDLKNVDYKACIFCPSGGIKTYKGEDHWIILDTAIFGEFDKILPPTFWDYIEPLFIKERLACYMDTSETGILPTTTTTILAETTTTTSISNVFLCCFGYSTLKYYWNETCEGGFQTTNCEYYAKISCNETCKSNGFLYGLEVNNQCVCSSEYSHETTTSTPSTIPTTTMPQGVECELDEDCICGIYCGCISKQQFSMERCMAPCESDEIKCICVSGKCIEKSKIYQATSNITTTTLSCTSGCFYEGACLSFGTRIILNNIPSYCDTTKTFKTQKQDNELCQNNYECLSNWCSNGVCINIQKELETQKGILQMILDWLKGLYSFFTFRWLSETTTSTTATIVTTITTLPTTTSTVPTMAWCRSTNFIIYSCIYNSSDNKLVIILNNHGAEDVRDLMVYLSFLNGTTLLMTKLNETLAPGEFRSYILSDIPSDFSKIIVSTQLCPDISKEDSCRRS